MVSISGHTMLLGAHAHKKMEKILMDVSSVLCRVPRDTPTGAVCLAASWLWFSRTENVRNVQSKLRYSAARLGEVPSTHVHKRDVIMMAGLSFAWARERHT